MVLLVESLSATSALIMSAKKSVKKITRHPFIVFDSQCLNAARTTTLEALRFPLEGSERDYSTTVHLCAVLHLKCARPAAQHRRLSR